MVARLAVAAVGCLWGLILGACGGGITPPTGPAPDFVLSLSPSAISVGQGTTSSPVTVSVAARNQFTGSVSVAITGLPEGTRSSLASPFLVAAGTSQEVTISASGVVTAGSYDVRVKGTSGSLRHTASLSLTVTETPVVLRTYQEGSLLVLESGVGNETVRVGLESLWGGTVVEASLNGINVVNRYDTGREVQVALYDGNEQYDACAGCTGVFGWDPVQGGDRYSQGSPLLEQTLGADSIYIKTQPYQWYPDDKGGGPGQPVLTDTYFEQTLSPVPNHAWAFNLHYRIIHFGDDQHANSGQEFPAVYVNLGFDRFIYYAGATPWAHAPVSATTMPSLPEYSPMLYTSELWGALVDTQDFGLTVYVPGQYPYAYGFNAPGDPGPTGFGTNYFHPFTPFTLGPGTVFEGDIYLVVGDYRLARRVVYDLHSRLPAQDIFTPFGWTDAPAANSELTGVVDVAGWTFDDGAVESVQVLVDGTVVGTATYGSPRPDVPAVYPNAPANVGFQYQLDTAQFVNGPHILEVRVTDSAGNVALFPRVPVDFNN